MEKQKLMKINHEIMINMKILIKIKVKPKG